MYNVETRKQMVTICETDVVLKQISPTTYRTFIFWLLFKKIKKCITICNLQILEKIIDGVFENTANSVFFKGLLPMSLLQKLIILSVKSIHLGNLYLILMFIYCDRVSIK